MYAVNGWTTEHYNTGKNKAVNVNNHSFVRSEWLSNILFSISGKWILMISSNRTEILEARRVKLPGVWN